MAMIPNDSAQGELPGMNIKSTTFEEAKKLGRRILELACNDAFKMTGERPHVEDRGDRLVVVWPDGEVTNEMTIQDISGENSFPV